MHLIHRDNNAEYARAPIIDDSSVEKCVDSSRYFVIRCVNPNPNVNQKIFIGIAFNERTHALDFKMALQEFQKNLQIQKELTTGSKHSGDVSSIDMSIKEGETMKVKAVFASTSVASAGEPQNPDEN